MDNLRLHNRGQQDHLKELEDAFHEKINNIRQDKSLSASMQEELINQAKDEVLTLKRNTLKNLY